MDLKYGQEIICIKTAKMKNGEFQRRACFKKGRTYIINISGSSVQDEFNQVHGVNEDKFFNRYFQIKSE